MLDTSRDSTDARTPCPACGSSARRYSLRIADTVTATDEVSIRVRRGVNEVRVAVLFVVLGISIGVGVTAGFEQNSAPLGLGVGLLIVLLRLVYRWPWLQHRVMALMHWVTGK